MERTGSTEMGGRLPRRKVLAHHPLPAPHLARESSDRGSSVLLELLLFTFPAPAVAGSPFPVLPLFLLVSGIYRSFPAHPWGWLSSGPRLFWLFEVPKPQVLPRGVLQQYCAAARQGRDGKEK